MVGPHPDDETRPAHSIPIELLKRWDPILFFDDNAGRQDPRPRERMLLLCRLFMRLDGVVARVRGTRVYVDFETDEVVREYTVKGDTYEELKKVHRSESARFVPRGQGMPDNGDRDSYFGGYDGAYGYGANCNIGVRTSERKFPVD
ncbi:TIP41-negatively regulates the TOR signaling pathway [Apiospora saccharicola]